MKIIAYFARFNFDNHRFTEIELKSDNLSDALEEIKNHKNLGCCYWFEVR